MVSVFELFVAGEGSQGAGGVWERKQLGGASAVGTSCQHGDGSLVLQGCPEAVCFFLPGVLSPLMSTFNSCQEKINTSHLGEFLMFSY